nr:hypothetical protein [Tanacetum cinerariifolium]
MDEPAVVTDSSGVPSAIEKSPLDFADEAGASGQGTAAPEVPLPEEVLVTTVPGGDQAAPVVVEPPPVQESQKRGREGIDANAPPKSLRREHADLQPSGVLADVSDPDPLAFADAASPPPADIIRSSQGVVAAGDPGSENVSSLTVVGSPRSVYWQEWGVTNGSLLDTPEACQDLVDHAAPPGYFSELHHMHNEDFLRQYNINLARQVAMGSQLRLRFEQEAKLLRKSVAQVARREQRIQARESEIKNLEVLLEAEADMKRAAKEKSWKRCVPIAGPDGRAAVCGDGCAPGCYELDFDEKLYPHMLTAIAGRRWVIGHGLRLATMKCAESMEMSPSVAEILEVTFAGPAGGLKGCSNESASLFKSGLVTSNTIEFSTLYDFNDLKVSAIIDIVSGVFVDVKKTTFDDILVVFHQQTNLNLCRELIG